MKHLKQKLRGLLFRFRKLKAIINTHHLKIMYQALVESQLNYGILVWGGVRKKYLTQLETLQRRFLKLIYDRNQRYPSNNLYKDSGMLDVRSIYARGLSTYQFKVKDSSEKILHQQNTRQKLDQQLVTLKANKEIGKRFFSYLAPRLFNNIPLDLRLSRNRYIFSKRVKKWLLSTDRQYIRDLLDLD